MTFGTYFPEQRHALTMTTIRRERLLPEGVLGEVEVRVGERVDVRDVIARGTTPGRYVILEAAQFFNTRKPDDLKRLLLVQEGAPVEAKQAIAGKNAARGKRLFSPVDGTVAQVSEGRIIIQETPEQIEVEAGLIGQVVAVHDQRGALIETVGAVLQGAWGNGRIAIGPLRMEDGEGLETVLGNEIDIQYRGTIVVTPRPIRERGFDVIEEHGLAAVVAPSMDIRLLERARALPCAILLTEGFGSGRMSQYVYGFLEQMAGKQATVDAVIPGRFESRRPEVIVNQPVRAGQRPQLPNHILALKPGMVVRLTRGNLAGQVGQIAHLPKTPYLLENGLRVAAAQVQLATGESAMIPLANLEVFG